MEVKGHYRQILNEYFGKLIMGVCFHLMLHQTKVVIAQRHYRAAGGPRG